MQKAVQWEGYAYRERVGIWLGGLAFGVCVVGWGVNLLRVI